MTYVNVAIPTLFLLRPTVIGILLCFGCNIVANFKVLLKSDVGQFDNCMSYIGRPLHTAAAKTAKLILGPGRLPSIQGLPASMLHSVVTMPHGVDLFFLQSDSADALIWCLQMRQRGSPLAYGKEGSAHLLVRSLHDCLTFAKTSALLFLLYPLQFCIRRMSEASKRIGEQSVTVKCSPADCLVL